MYSSSCCSSILVFDDLQSASFSLKFGAGFLEIEQIERRLKLLWHAVSSCLYKHIKHADRYYTVHLPSLYIDCTGNANRKIK